MAYRYFKDVPRRTASDKVLRDKKNCQNILNMMDINVNLVQWFINFLIKKTCGRAVKSEIMPNQELADVIHKPTIRKFEKRQVY